MWLYIKLAWRNIFRNKRRTMIAGTAIGIGLASLIFTDALIVGMKENMIRSATDSFLGQGEIYRVGYQETQDVQKTIVDLGNVVRRLNEEPIVEHYSVRVMAQGMISSPANMSQAGLVGVEPHSERYLSQFDDAIIEGSYFEGDNPRDIVIGDEMADLLEVGIGDRTVLTVAQAETGELSQEMFRISGIFHMNVEEMDKGMALIRIKKARDMLNLPGKAHIIALKFTNISYGQDKNLPFWNEFSTDGNEAVGWPVLVPQLQAALQMSSFSTYLVGIILFSVVALGIINTLFMSLYERMFEFGVMRAVGTSPFAIGRLVVFEAGALAVLSIILGSILGLIVTLITAKTGIDYSGIEFAGVTFRELLYPVLEVKQFIEYPFWVFVITVVVGLYPAVYAAKLRPAEAMRKSV
ncbi:MAG: ABC transporter permease [Candidatus Zixiibacteriota bacterium]|jgi:ABC-type lipoprotein release transport system permease subunit